MYLLQLAELLEYVLNIVIFLFHSLLFHPGCMSWIHTFAKQCIVSLQLGMLASGWGARYARQWTITCANMMRGTEFSWGCKVKIPSRLVEVLFIVQNSQRTILPHLPLVRQRMPKSFILLLLPWDITRYSYLVFCCYVEIVLVIEKLQTSFLWYIFWLFPFLIIARVWVS